MYVIYIYICNFYTGPSHHPHPPALLPASWSEAFLAQHQQNRRVAQHPTHHEDCPDDPVVEGDPLYHFRMLLWPRHLWSSNDPDIDDFWGVPGKSVKPAQGGWRKFSVGGCAPIDGKVLLVGVAVMFRVFIGSFFNSFHLFSNLLHSSPLCWTLLGSCQLFSTLLNSFWPPLSSSQIFSTLKNQEMWMQPLQWDHMDCKMLQFSTHATAAQKNSLDAAVPMHFVQLGSCKAAYYSLNQWEFQDPKMEVLVLYHIRPYVGGIFPQTYMVGTSNQSVPGMAISGSSGLSSNAPHNV